MIKRTSTQMTTTLIHLTNIIVLGVDDMMVNKTSP